MHQLWKGLKSSAVLTSHCPSNHSGAFRFPEDFTPRCLDEPPSKYPDAKGLSSPRSAVVAALKSADKSVEDGG
jgi:hypothetical protein